MNILVCSFGSFGDVHPFVGLALALQVRGHGVTVAINGYFRDLVERVGLEFVELGTQEEYLEQAAHPDLWHPRRSFAYLFRTGVNRVMRQQYALIADRFVPGQMLVLGNCYCFGACIAREKLGVPLVTVHCQPASLWSEYDSPVFAGMIVGDRTPRWFKRLQYRLGEIFILDWVACPETNRFRTELGLPSMRQVTRWWHSPDGVLCLFPEWFSPRQPDWPPNVWLTQFPLWDEDTVREPQPEVEGFLSTGEAPVVFTPGSSNAQAAPFFQAAVEACHRLGRRGLLLSRFPEQIPPNLPPGVRYFEYVPLSRVLPRAAALVHQGGIGTTAQGLRAGIPQLLMPLAYDQPDNAARLKRLGVGDWLKPSVFRGPPMAEALQRLLTSVEVKGRCEQVAAKFAGVDPFAEACDAVEQFAMRHGLSTRRPTVSEDVA